jgi:hypothetical protein
LRIDSDCVLVIVASLMSDSEWTILFVVTHKLLGQSTHELNQSNVPVHPLLEDLWDRQLGLSRRATGLLDCASLTA